MEAFGKEERLNGGLTNARHGSIRREVWMSRHGGPWQGRKLKWRPGCRRHLTLLTMSASLTRSTLTRSSMPRDSQAAISFRPLLSQRHLATLNKS